MNLRINHIKAQTELNFLTAQKAKNGNNFFPHLSKNSSLNKHRSREHGEPLNSFASVDIKRYQSDSLRKK